MEIAAVGKNPPTAQGRQVVFYQSEYCDLGQKVNTFYAFFCLQNKIFSVHRRMNLDSPEVALQHGSYYSEILLSQYQWRDGVLKQYSQKHLCSGEDPRVVSDGQRAYVVCKGSLIEDPPESTKLVILPDETEVFVRLPKNIAPGKNWQPYLRNQQLHIVHQFSPLTVFRILADGSTRNIVCSSTEYGFQAPHDQFPMARGGSNGLVMDQTLIGLGHLSVRRCDHRPFIWLHAADSGMRLVIPSVFFGVREKGFNIVDPTSLFHFDEHLYIGVCASEREWFYGQRFLSFLISIPMAKSSVISAIQNNEIFYPPDHNEFDDLYVSKTLVPVDMPHQVSYESKEGYVGSAGESGCLVHGPYERVEKPCQYTAWLSYSCNASGSDKLMFDEFSANRFEISFFREGDIVVVAHCELPDTNQHIVDVSLKFSTDEHVGWLLETCVFVGADSDLRVLNIRLVESSD